MPGTPHGIDQRGGDPDARIDVRRGRREPFLLLQDRLQIGVDRLRVERDPAEDRIQGFVHRPHLGGTGVRMLPAGFRHGIQKLGRGELLLDSVDDVDCVQR